MSRGGRYARGRHGVARLTRRLSSPSWGGRRGGIPRRAILIGLSGLLLFACGNARARLGQTHIAHSGPVHISPTGEIGPLHVAQSDRAEVIAFAGKPDAESRGRYFKEPPFDALGYECAGNQATTQRGAPKCRTVFYLDARTRRLALLYTKDPRYQFRGSHAGMTTVSAQRKLHRRAGFGCGSSIRFYTKRAFLVLMLGGGKSLIGKRVAYVVVHSRRLNPHVFDCIDS
jgi:hypothetical protein